MFTLKENDKSYRPEDFGTTALPGHIHPSPEQIDRTLYIPGADGLFHFGSNFGVRTFELPMLVIPQQNKIELQKRIRAFTSIFYTSTGKPKELELSFDYEPEKYYIVRISNRIVPNRLLTLSEFTLVLTANDPYAYADQNYIPEYVDNSLQYDSGYNYEPPQNHLIYGEPKSYFYENGTEFNWLYSRQYSSIYNFADMQVPLAIEVEGSVNYPRLTNLTTGVQMQLPSISNQVMVIDANRFTVKVDGVSKLTLHKGDFLHLAPTLNQLLFEGGSPNAAVRYKWNHKFI
ncbi:phage tail domain-containing protein [Sutcliffiella horikoshii]|uniref:Phage tail protein n=1 Tax=Sutcliffiella horikoshii TaxID=79883 RepID=A0A5D4TFH7_9BACI|nr:phage tail domain-containing protein [Sutcliffiella horikoshii]TYS74523.1 hypothetical protein FZC75_02160 [Sutcliffiella horikoshii]